MKQWKFKDFISLVEKNGYSLVRNKGSHYIYSNSEGKHISIPIHIRCVIAQRLIKEHNLHE